MIWSGTFPPKKETTLPKGSIKTPPMPPSFWPSGPSQAPSVNTIHDSKQDGVIDNGGAVRTLSQRNLSEVIWESDKSIFRRPLKAKSPRTLTALLATLPKAKDSNQCNRPRIDSACLAVTHFSLRMSCNTELSSSRRSWVCPRRTIPDSKFSKSISTPRLLNTFAKAPAFVPSRANSTPNRSNKVSTVFAVLETKASHEKTV